MIAFGAMEILFSQIPDFDQISWLSIVAAVMSFTYSSIGLALGISKVAGTKLIKLLNDLIVFYRSSTIIRCMTNIVLTIHLGRNWGNQGKPNWD